MKSGKSTSVHRSMQTAECMERPAAEAFQQAGRNELITSFLPHTDTMRKSWSWQMMTRRGPWKQRLAAHEAGHIVVMEMLLGLNAGLKAEISAAGGVAHWPENTFKSIGEPEPDPSGVWAATAASVFHAGAIAELLHEGATWRGPIFYPEQSDYTCSNEMLRPVFGNHASGAHAFAQKVALNVLTDRWDRVQEIAAHLVEHGQWQFDPATTENQFPQT